MDQIFVESLKYIPKPIKKRLDKSLNRAKYKNKYDNHDAREEMSEVQREKLPFHTNWAAKADRIIHFLKDLPTWPLLNS